MKGNVKQQAADEFTIVMDDPSPVEITVEDNQNISKQLEELVEPEIIRHDDEMEESLRQVEQEFDIIKEYLCTLQKAQINYEKPEVLSNRIRTEILEKILCILRNCKELESEEIIQMNLSMFDGAKREAASMNMLKVISEKLRSTYIDEKSMDDLNKRYLSFQSSLECSIDCVKDHEDLYKTTQLKLIELKKENDKLQQELSIEKQKSESLKRKLELTKKNTTSTTNKMKNVLLEARSLREDIQKQNINESIGKNEMSIQMENPNNSSKSETTDECKPMKPSVKLTEQSIVNEELSNAVLMSNSSCLLDEPDDSCLICDRIFPPTMEVVHRRSHVTSHFKRECYICNMKFTEENLEKLIIHLKSCEAFYL
ncbi:hypothetical protein SNEBB_006083 [Seison nebaliae]|nr:hypothetical protein SNEBB_006083 [Seison nebaliae]